MAPEIADVTDGDREILARLPLNVERLVHGVGKLIPPVVIREREKLRAVGDGLSVRQVNLRWIAARRTLAIEPPGVRERAAVWIRERGLRRVASGNESLKGGCQLGTNL